MLSYLSSFVRLMRDLQGLRQGSLDRPTSFNPKKDSDLRDRYFLGPFRNRQTFTLKLKNVVAATVICLCHRSSPPAIIGRIPLVVINAIYRIFWPWFWPHVMHELFKAISPSVTNCYAAAAIVFVSGDIRIFTAVYDGCPYSILWRVRHAVRSIALNRPIARQTTTTFASALLQRPSANYAFVAAITKAKPHRTTVLRAYISKHDKTTKPLSGQVFDPLVCNGNNFWGIIHSVFGPPRPLTKPGTPQTSPGIFVYLHSFILPFFDRFGGVSSLTVKAVA